MENDVEATMDGTIEHEMISDSEVSHPSTEENNQQSDESKQEAIQTGSPDSFRGIGTDSLSGETDLVDSLQNDDSDLTIHNEIKRFDELSDASSVFQCSEDSGKLIELPASEDNHDESQLASVQTVSNGDNGSVGHNAHEDGDGNINQGRTDIGEHTDSEAIDGESGNLKDKNVASVNSNNSEQLPEADVPYKSYANALRLGNTIDVDAGSKDYILETLEGREVSDLEQLEKEKKLHNMQVLDVGGENGIKESNIGSDVPPNGPSIDADTTLSLNHEIMESNPKCENLQENETTSTPDMVDKSSVCDNEHSKHTRDYDGDRNESSHNVSSAILEENKIMQSGMEVDTENVKERCDNTVADSAKLEIGDKAEKLQVVSAMPVHEVNPASDVSSASDDRAESPESTRHVASPLVVSSQTVEQRSQTLDASSSTNIISGNHTRPAGLGRGAPPLEPTFRAVPQPRTNGTVSAIQNQLTEDPANGEPEEYDETREKLQMIRVKFLRLAHRLGQTPHNVVVAQVLYRLGLAEQLHGRSGGRVAAFSFDRASAMAEQLESAGQEPLDFTCTIMILGKSGVGKSATINSVFDEPMFSTDAFQLGTKKVQDIVGRLQGIKVRVIDTPGLLPSWSDQNQNEKILRSVKRFIKKSPPDIVLYLDRLDMQSRDFSDMPLLSTITGIFGPSIWFNAIVVLTHAASAPPDGPNGTTTSYDMFVSQRSHVVQQAIRQAAGDTRLMNPVSLVENHSACRTNRAGQKVLPNGQVWKPHLLLLSFASKILAEANTLLKLQDTPTGRNFSARARSPPLPFLLSSLLQSRPEIKLQSEQFGDDDDDMDDDPNGSLDVDDVSEYEELPPFKALTKAELATLTKMQRKAYYDELEYREQLFMKSQIKAERRRRKMMKKLKEASKDIPSEFSQNGEEEEASNPASIQVPMSDIVLPASFDSSNPTHRYRSLDSSTPWIMRAVPEPNGWDHDVGYDGVNVERLFVVKEMIPISFSSHFSKDKKDGNLQMELASTIKHGKAKSTSLGFEMKSIGKDFTYTMRSDTKFSNNKVNKAIVGLSATVLGDIVTGGAKLENNLTIGRYGRVIMSGGAMYGRGEVSLGGSLEATLRDKENPLSRFLSTIGLSVMDWHGDLAIGCNSQTQIPIGRHTNLIGSLNINNRGSGQFTIRINSSEHLQIVLMGLIPLVTRLMGYSQ